MKAVILAAGRGTRLEPLTTNMPKCLVPVGGVPLIDRMIERLGEAGIEKIVVVTGHAHDVLETHLRASSNPLAAKALLVFNDHYADWGNCYSLLVAQDAVWDQDFIRLDGDVLLGEGLVEQLLAADGPLVLAVDRSVVLADEEMKVQVSDSNFVVALNKGMAPDNAVGEFIGVERIDSAMVPSVFGELHALIDDGKTGEYYERAYERLMEQGIEFRYTDVTGRLWCEIDDAADLEHANELIARDTVPGSDDTIEDGD